MATKTQTGSSYSSTLSLISALVGVGCTPSSGRFTPGKDIRYTLDRRPNGARAGLDGGDKSRPPIGIRSQDRPGRSESLYRLSCCGRPLRLSALVERNLLTRRTNIALVYSNSWHSRATSAVEFNLH